MANQSETNREKDMKNNGENIETNDVDTHPETTPQSSTSDQLHLWPVLIGVALIALLAGALAYWAWGIGRDDTDTGIEMTTSSDTIVSEEHSNEPAQAVFTRTYASFGPGENRGVADIVLVDTQTGQEKEIKRIQFPTRDTSPYTQLDGTKLYYQNNEGKIAQYNIAADTEQVLPFEFEAVEEADMLPLKDFVVNGDDIAYTVWTSSAGCDIYRGSISSGESRLIISIPECNIPHGPYHSLYDITDAGDVRVIRQFGEGAYHSVSLAQINQESEELIIIEQSGTGNAGCGPGGVYGTLPGATCTDEERAEYEQYKKFIREYRIGPGPKSAQCESLSITPLEDKWNSEYRVVMPESEEVYKWGDIQYRGCLE